MAEWVELVLRETFILAGAVFFIVRTFNGISALQRVRVWRQIVPLVPIALGIGGSLLGGIAGTEDASTMELIEKGVWAGAASMAFHKILGQTFLGDDPVLDAYRKVERHARMDEDSLARDLGGADVPRRLAPGEANEPDGGWSEEAD